MDCPRTPWLQSQGCDGDAGLIELNAKAERKARFNRGDNTASKRGSIRWNLDASETWAQCPHATARAIVYAICIVASRWLSGSLVLSVVK